MLLLSLVLGLAQSPLVVTAETSITGGREFKGVAMNIPGSPTQWEILEPFGDDSFLHRFLAERGPGMHHATFEVEDIEKAAATLRRYGVEPFGEGIANDWKQLFIHPRDSGGVLIQLYEKVNAG